MPPGQRYAEHELTAEMKVSRRLVGLSRNQTMLQAFEGLTERIRIIRRFDFTSLSLFCKAHDEHSEIEEVYIGKPMNSNNARFYIDGAWVSPAVPKSFEFVNPATRSRSARSALGRRRMSIAPSSCPERHSRHIRRRAKQERLALLPQIIAANKRGSATSPSPLLGRWDRRFGFPKRSRLRPHWTILKKSVRGQREPWPA